MLTDRQREKCREIAAALDRHDQGPWLKAEPSLGPEARGLIWDLRAHVVAAGGRAAKAAGNICAECAQQKQNCGSMISITGRPMTIRMTATMTTTARCFRAGRATVAGAMRLAMSAKPATGPA